jgi:low affinity Fe/Cu permease
MKNIFRATSNRVSSLAGSPAVFIFAVLCVVIWIFSGPHFNYSDTWQLVINTATTIVTFLMVFLIQNTQNRDGKAVQLKLDELIRVTKGARQQYVGLENLNDEELAELDRQFKIIAGRPGVTRAIKKLHESIEQEHSKRKQSSNKIMGVPLPHLKSNSRNQQPRL